MMKYNLILNEFALEYRFIELLGLDQRQYIPIYYQKPPFKITYKR